MTSSPSMDPLSGESPVGFAGRSSDQVLKLFEQGHKQGAAMSARLVSDRSSPLYRDGGQRLGSAVLSARLTLDRSAQVRQDLASAA